MKTKANFFQRRLFGPNNHSHLENAKKVKKKMNGVSTNMCLFQSKQVDSLTKIFLIACLNPLAMVVLFQIFKGGAWIPLLEV